MPSKKREPLSAETRERLIASGRKLMEGCFLDENDNVLSTEHAVFEVLEGAAARKVKREAIWIVRGWINEESRHENPRNPNFQAVGS